MINLIPNEEKKKMVHNFYYRLVILLLFMFGFATCFAILAISPSYVFSRSKENVVNEKLSIQEAEPVPVLDQKTLDAMQDLDHKLSLVENVQANKFVVSEKIINEIMNSKVLNIKITRISYDNNGVDGQKIGIYGTAPSRERLLLFRYALEDNVSFQNVDSPISNFIKGSNIQFYLTLIPRSSAD